LRSQRYTYNSQSNAHSTDTNDRDQYSVNNWVSEQDDKTDVEQK
jgi:hypothetical protein